MREKMKWQHLASRAGETLRRVTRRRVLRLEAIEDRTLLSLFTVVNLNDNGTGSLRSEIALANANSGADVIAFAKGLKGTIDLTSGQIDITNPVTIQGPGSSSLKVSARGRSRVLLVGTELASTAPLHTTIAGLTITGGNVTAPDVDSSISLGGGILQHGGTLTLINCVVTGNSASNVNPPADTLNQGVAEGGGIAVLGGGTLIVKGGAVTHNTAAGLIALGGGVSTIGSTLSILKATVSANAVTGATLTSGGGIALDRQSTLNIDSSTIGSNRARTTGGMDLNASLVGSALGGGIAVEGGSTAHLTRSKVAGNLAQGGSGRNGSDAEQAHQGGGAFGGGIFVGGFSALDLQVAGDIGLSTLVVNSTSLSDNAAQAGNGGDGAAQGFGGAGGFAYGGALAVYLDCNVAVTGGAVKHNRAIGGIGGAGGIGGMGGASAGSGGGGISLISASAIVKNSNFLANAATGGDAGIGGEGNYGGFAGSSSGGAVFAYGGALFSPTIFLTILTVRTSGFGGNLVEAGRGGDGVAGGLGGTGGDADGGAISSILNPSVTVNDSQFRKNVAIAGAGGNGSSGNDGGSAGGGAVANQGSTTTLIRDIFDGNLVSGGAGGATSLRSAGGIDGYGGNARGGAVFSLIFFSNSTSDSAYLSLSRDTLMNNFAQGGSGTAGGSGLGGGLFTGNRINDVTGDSAASAFDVTVTRNVARGGVGQSISGNGTGSGGGAYNENAAVTIAGKFRVVNNTASTSDNNVVGLSNRTPVNLRRKAAAEKEEGVSRVSPRNLPEKRLLQATLRIELALSPPH